MIEFEQEKPEVLQMKKTKITLEKNHRIWIVVVVGIVTVIALIIGIQMWRQGKENRSKIQQGVKYLESLEKQDVAAISSRIDAVRAAQSLELSETDENAVWRGFDGAMILGDSRAVGFEFFEFLLEDQVIAESGRKITDVQEEIEEVKKINPKQIFLCFGLNDIRSELWPEPADYAAAYQQVVALLNQELPGTMVYINSILPAMGSGLAEYEGYSRIGEYNAALQEMAEANGYRYIDNTAVAEEHVELYEIDGLHLQKDFYKYWAMNMLKGVKEQ